MKKMMVLSLIMFLTVILGLTPLYSQEFLEKTLDNGLKIIVKKNTTNNSFTIATLVKTGSMDEGKFLGMGLSHNLEHVVSGGTTVKRTEDQYNKILKKIGAIKNAYTTYDHTLFYINANTKYFDDALSIMAENMNECVFYQKEVDREKKVILKEFVYRSSPPRAKMFQKHNEVLYQKSNLKYPVIGYIDLYKKLKRDDLAEYYKDRYMPNNMIVVACGNFKNKNEIMNKIVKAFSKYPRRVLKTPPLPIETPRIGNFKYVEEFGVKSCWGIISKIIPASDCNDEIALELATDILFGKRNSPIKTKLVEELKLVDFIEGEFDDHGTSTQGVLNIYFTTKFPEKMDKIVKIMDEEIAKIIKKGITKKDIDTAIKRYEADKILSTPASEEEAEEIARNFLKYGITDVKDYKISAFKKLTPEKVTKVISKYFAPEERVIFYGLPKGEKQKLATAQKDIIVSKVQKISIDKNIVLLYKQDNRNPIVSGKIILRDSTIEYETIKNYGIISIMTDMLLNGSKKYPPKKLQNWMEDHMVTLKDNVGINGISISFRCLKSDFPELQNILVDLFKNPIFDEKEFLLYKNRKESSIKRSLSNPQVIHDDFRNSVLYSGKRDSLSKKDRLNIILKLKREDLLSAYKKYFRSKNLLFSMYGDITIDETKNYISKLSKNIIRAVPEGKKISLEVPNFNKTFKNKYGYEQVNINFNFKAATISDKDYYTLVTLNNLLTGNGNSGKLFEAVRGRNTLAYFTYSSYVATKKYGFFRITAQTSIDKMDRLIKTIKDEIEKLETVKVTKNEIIESALEHYNSIKSSLTEEGLFNNMVYYESIGLGYNYLDDSLNKLKKITPEMVQKCAKKYFKNMAIIISYPDKNVERIIK